MKTLSLVTLLGLSSCSGCQPAKGCVPRSTRCESHEVQVCSAEGRWQGLADCDMVSEYTGQAFACLPVTVGEQDGHACVRLQIR